MNPNRQESSSSRVFATMVVSFIAAGVSFAQKSPDVRLDVGTLPGAAQSSAPQMAASGNSVYVVWADTRNGSGDIYFNRSLDGGATWLVADVRLDTGDAPGSSDSGDQRISSSGSSLYVTWRDRRPGNTPAAIYFNRSLDGGATWLPTDVRISDATSAVYGLQAMAASGTSVYVAWSDVRSQLAEDIYFNRSLDGGTTWLPSDVRLDVGAVSPANSENPELAASGSSVCVTWQDFRNGGFSAQDIYCNRSLDGGVTWLPADVRLDTGSNPGAAQSDLPQIAASGSSYFVTWQDWRNGFADIYFNRSLDGGTSWLPVDVRLDVGSAPGTASSNYPHLQASGTAVRVVWTDNRNGAFDIYFNRSLDSGAAWLPADLRLDLGSRPGAGDSYSVPRLAASGESVYAIWWDFRSAPQHRGDVYFNRSLDGGATWLASDVRLDVGSLPGAAISQDTVLAASGSSVYAAWVDSRNGSGDIYFNLASGAQPYGAGLAGSGGLEPTLSASGDIAIGGAVTLTVANARGGATGRLDYSFNGQASLPLRGGTLWLARPLLGVALTFGGTPGTPGAGSAARTFAIPNDTALLGLRLNMQAGVFDPGAVQGIALTSALELWTL